MTEAWEIPRMLGSREIVLAYQWDKIFGTSEVEGTFNHKEYLQCSKWGRGIQCAYDMDWFYKMCKHSLEGIVDVSIVFHNRLYLKISQVFVIYPHPHPRPLIQGPFTFGGICLFIFIHSVLPPPPELAVFGEYFCRACCIKQHRSITPSQGRMIWEEH